MSVAGVISIVVQLIFLEGILSIDNAAVLGAMVAHLPTHEPIPWPGPLKRLHAHGERILGGQRQAALKVGLLGAYVGRASMLFLASFVIRNPWLRLLGAIYLVKLAAEHLGELVKGKQPETDAEGLPVKPKGRGFWSVVLAVELADLAFSLDNVVVAVALSDEFWVVMLGVALGIVTMRFAAGIFSVLVEKEPILIHAAYILILNVGLELIIADLTHVEIGEMTKFAISVLTLLVALAYAHISPLQKVQPLLRPIGHLLWWLNWSFNLPFLPLKFVVKQIARLLRPRPKPRPSREG